MYPPQQRRLFVFCTVSVISVNRCMDCYPTTSSKDFMFWLLDVISSEAKTLPLTWISQVYKYTMLGFTHYQREDFFVFCNNGKHHWQRLFDLDCCSVTFNEAKRFPLKISLPSLGVAFSQTRYSLVRDPYHQEFR